LSDAKIFNKVHYNTKRERGLPNPNSKFKDMLNFGGDSGSQRHLVGVHDMTRQSVLACSFSLNLAKLLFSSLLVSEEELFATTSRFSFTSSRAVELLPTSAISPCSSGMVYLQTQTFHDNFDFEVIFW